MISAAAECTGPCAHPIHNPKEGLTMNDEMLLEEFAITELEQRIEFSICCGQPDCDDPMDPGFFCEDT
jgi:hypothetical protein